MDNRDDRNFARREARRRRRKRAQILSFIVLLIFVLVVGIGAFFGMKQIVKYMENKKSQELVEKQTEEIPTDVEISEPSTEEVAEETDDLDTLVDSNISGMSLEDKVAGLFMITPEALTDVGKAIQAGDGTKKALEQYPVGGLIYFEQNIIDADQLKKMLANTIMYSKYPLFMGVDEEGGKVARLGNSKLGVDKVDEAAAIGATGDSGKAYAATETIARYLAEYGFNLDFAPVADVVTNPENEVIGTRSYSSDPEVVATMVQSAIEGLQDNRVSACMKHFPGLGDVSTDPHEETTATEKSLADMRECDLIPYITGIEAGSDMIMISNMSAPQVTGDNTPCCMSGLVVSDVLRTELGYNGIVITDAMNMKAISDNYSSAEAAVQSIQAGVDIILMPDNFKEAYQGVLDAVKAGTITEERIDESLHRIYRVKYRESQNLDTEGSDTDTTEPETEPETETETTAE
ncbi:MAG: glycoside hydrolase family 3 protein [Lachnospiraceae bacterium]|nr:glycoside hydrolase family 3 protein [Lachnospiraceae bacterium]